VKHIHGGVTAPQGFRAGGIFCGIKKSKKKDLAIIVSDRMCLASGVFTSNKVQASCVTFNRERLRSGEAQAVIVNSGNANCLTGKGGYANTVKMAAAAARELGVSPKRVLVGSTGVIGVPLPMKRILAGIPVLVKTLSRHGSPEAAHAILTTDRMAKEAAIEIRIGRRKVRVGAIAKGAGMIHPDMKPHATMLCYVTTDAVMTPHALRDAVSRASGKSFNMISIDADQSTNDMLVVLANGAAQNRIIREKTKELRLFCRALDAISSVVRQSAELVQEISLASKQQVRGTEGVAHAMQIISGFTRQTSQGIRQTVSTVGHLVKLSDQLNESLAQFRSNAKASAAETPAQQTAPAGANR